MSTSCLSLSFLCTAHMSLIYKSANWIDLCTLLGKRTAKNITFLFRKWMKLEKRIKQMQYWDLLCQHMLVYVCCSEPFEGKARNGTGKFPYIVFLYAKVEIMRMIQTFDVKFKLAHENKVKTKITNESKIKYSYASLPARLKHLKKPKGKLHTRLLYLFVSFLQISWPMICC